MAIILEFPKSKTVSTTISLDELRERGLITAKQHWVGIHLRWLHNIHMGAGHDDAGWRRVRESDYKNGLDLLEKNGCGFTVFRLCVRDKIPTSTCIPLLDKGLNLLVSAWMPEKNCG